MCCRIFWSTFYYVLTTDKNHVSIPIKANPDDSVFGQELYFPVLLLVSYTNQVCVVFPAVQSSISPAHVLLNKNETLIGTGCSYEKERSEKEALKICQCASKQEVCVHL